MPYPQTGATHAQLELSDKGRAIKGLVVCNRSRALGPAKRSGPRLLSTVP